MAPPRGMVIHPYQLLPDGVATITALVVLRDKVLRPLLAAMARPFQPIRLKMGRKPRFWDRAQDHYQRLRRQMYALLSVCSCFRIDRLLSMARSQAPRLTGRPSACAGRGKGNEVGNVVAVTTQGVAAQGTASVSRQQEVEALCSGAATLSREGNGIAALALLWAAVAVEPTDFVAHRRLAATLANAGDVDAAAEEYARFIEFLLKQDDVRRAAGELVYARAFLGDMPQLRSAATYPVPLAEVARALDRPAQTHASLSIGSAHSAATRTNSDLNGAPPNAPQRSTEALRSNLRHSRSRELFWSVRWPSSHWRLELFQVLIMSLAAAALTIVVAAVAGLR